MCGICGFIAPADAVAPEGARRRVAAMAQRLAHRGPDDAGASSRSVVDADGRGWTLALGHRRLAVIDPGPGGRQPMSTPDGAVTLVYNGEIYNYRELRRQLAGRGARFATRTDTEVILHGWRAWREELFDRLHGMFALAIWDDERGELVLARDRLGIKPLCVAPAPSGGIAFASEVRALFDAPELDARVDSEAVRAYLELSWIPAPRTILRGVRRLEPGTWLRWCAGRTDGRRWWSVDAEIGSASVAAPSQRETGARRALARSTCVLPAREVGRAGRASESDPARAFDELLRDAVRRRLVADVPLGAFLSGGVDSTLVVATMARVGAPRIDTFCVGFDESSFDESPWARAVAEHLGTRHHELRVTPDDARAEAAALARRLDEPLGDPAALPAWLVSRFARESGVTVALSGDGGDELFGGYSRYRLTERLARIVALPAPLRAFARAALCLAPSARARRAAELTRGCRSLSDVYAQRLVAWKGGDAASLVAAPEPVAATAGATHPGDAASEARAWADGPGDAAPLGAYEHAPAPTRAATLYAQRFAALPPLSPFDALGRVDVDTYLVDDVLAKVDRTSMAVGLEVRVPLLDHRIVGFAFGLPGPARRRWARDKRLLRELVARYVPRRLVERPKHGFAVPVEDWLRGPLRSELERALDPDRLRAEGLLDAGRTHALVEDFLAGRARCPRLMWSLFMLQLWIESSGVFDAAGAGRCPGGSRCPDIVSAC